ncbi:MAG: hypothetical protein HQK86_13210 [Nitrospinae bacterium]|nr:hypothetical protein [Nitrospinota bacterium]MBF0634363.1 hypothetical protein [Nitrospinota bacterium]
MGNQNEKKISSNVTATINDVLKVAAVIFIFITAVATLPAYAETAKGETATVSTHSDESLITSGFKPFRALSSEPNQITDRVKLLHGNSYFILSNLNNFTYKPFHGQSMWIGEFAIPDSGSRLEVVFDIGSNNVIAVAGYRLIAAPSQSAPVQATPPAHPSSPPQTVYAPATRQQMTRKPSHDYEWKPTFNISLAFGETSLNKDYWKPVDRQFTTNVTGDYNPGNWPVNLLLEISYSYDDTGGYWSHRRYTSTSNYVEGQMAEFSVGARKYLIDSGMVRPYLSAGVSSVSVDLWSSTGGTAVTDNSSSLGYFGNGGVLLVVNRFYAGFDLKVLEGTKINLIDVSGDANYSRWSFLFGVSF